MTPEEIIDQNLKSPVVGAFKEILRARAESFREQAAGAVVHGHGEARVAFALGCSQLAADLADELEEWSV